MRAVTRILRRRKICVPVISERVQHIVERRTIERILRFPRVLIDDADRQTEFVLIKSFDRIENAQNLRVGRRRTARCGNILKIGLGGEFDDFETGSIFKTIRKNVIYAFFKFSSVSEAQEKPSSFKKIAFL